MTVLESDIKKNKKDKKSIQIFKNGKNTILYPIFSECKRYTTDDFWKNLFDDLSIGKCPKSIYISNDIIYSSNKKKGFSYIIPTDNTKTPKEVFTELRELLINNTSICSSLDVSKKKEEIRKKQEEEILDDISDETTWSEIRKKNTREIFIIKFVIRMKKKYKLDWCSARHLYSLIQLGFIYKTQTSKDVNFENKRIENIDGIVYDEEQKIFVNEFEKEELLVDDEKEDTDKYLYYYWDRYVSSVSRHVL